MMIEKLSAAIGRNDWLSAACDRIAAEPDALTLLMSAAGRHCGRSQLASLPGWRADDAARVLMLAAVPLRGPDLAAAVSTAYWQGDADEKRAVLLALPALDVGTGCADLLRDALRTNDTRLVAAALGPYARHLDDETWRQGVLKCVFMEVPLAVVDRLDERADDRLATMLAAYSAERQAAGRTIPADAAALEARLTQGGHHADL
jgi:hypothetical protein